MCTIEFFFYFALSDANALSLRTHFLCHNSYKCDCEWWKKVVNTCESNESLIIVTYVMTYGSVMIEVLVCCIAHPWAK